MSYRCHYIHIYIPQLSHITEYISSHKAELSTQRPSFIDTDTLLSCCFSFSRARARCLITPIRYVFTRYFWCCRWWLLIFTFTTQFFMFWCFRHFISPVVFFDIAWFHFFRLFDFIANYFSFRYFLFSLPVFLSFAASRPYYFFHFFFIIHTYYFTRLISPYFEILSLSDVFSLLYARYYYISFIIFISPRSSLFYFTYHFDAAFLHYFFTLPPPGHIFRCLPTCHTSRHHASGIRHFIFRQRQAFRAISLLPSDITAPAAHVCHARHRLRFLPPLSVRYIDGAQRFAPVRRRHHATVICLFSPSPPSPAAAAFPRPFRRTNRCQFACCRHVHAPFVSAPRGARPSGAAQSVAPSYAIPPVYCTVHTREGKGSSPSFAVISMPITQQFRGSVKQPLS